MAHKGVSDQLSRQGVIPPGVFYFFRCCITFQVFHAWKSGGNVEQSFKKVEQSCTKKSLVGTLNKAGGETREDQPGSSTLRGKSSSSTLT